MASQRNFLPLLKLLEKVTCAAASTSRDTLEDLASQIRQAAADAECMVVFDWPSWDNQAKKLYENSDLLQEANTETLCKLITFHIRKNRFVEGHLEEAILDGHFLKILLRLHELTKNSHQSQKI